MTSVSWELTHCCWVTQQVGGLCHVPLPGSGQCPSAVPHLRKHLLSAPQASEAIPCHSRDPDGIHRLDLGWSQWARGDRGPGERAAEGTRPRPAGLIHPGPCTQAVANSRKCCPPCLWSGPKSSYDDQGPSRGQALGTIHSSHLGSIQTAGAVPGLMGSSWMGRAPGPTPPSCPLLPQCGPPGGQAWRWEGTELLETAHPEGQPRSSVTQPFQENSSEPGGAARFRGPR